MADDLSEMLSLLNLKLKVMMRLQSFSRRAFKKKKLLGLLLSEILKACRCKSGSLLLIDPYDQTLVFEVVRGPKSRALAGHRIPVTKGIVGRVARIGEAVHVPNPEKDPFFDPAISRRLRVPNCAILCAPIWDKEKIIGVLEVIQSKKNVPFKPSDIDLLKSVCQQAGFVIEKAHEIEGDKDRIKRLNVFIQIFRAINAERNVKKLLKLIATSATQLLRARECFILLKRKSSLSEIMSRIR